MIIRKKALILAFGPLQATAGACDLPPSEIERLIKYEAWSDYWLHTEFGRFQSQNFDVVNEVSAWLLFNTETRTGIRIDPSRVSSMTCKESDTAIQCLESIRNLKYLSTRDALLGRAEQRSSLSSDKEVPLNHPRVEIEYCTQCRWLLRAAWVAQELLMTFQDEIGEMVLLPGTGGVFEVRIEEHAVWSRAVQGRFPEMKELKQLVRDRIAPGRDLGHSDR